MKYVVIGIVLVLILYVILMYNSLIKLKNIVENGIAQIDTQLKRRFDLIPNLVECVKMYMKHESETLEKIVEKRSTLKEGTLEEKADVLKEINSSIKDVLVSVEAYPDLKASQNFLKLQEELKITEDKIAFARQFYNDSVTRYNNKLLVFPNNIISKIFGFRQQKYFEIEDNERENVNIKLQ